MPTQKTKKPVPGAKKPAAKLEAKVAIKAAASKKATPATAKTHTGKSEARPKPVPESKPATKAPIAESKKGAATPAPADAVTKKKPGRPPKAASGAVDVAPAGGAKRGRKPKSAAMPDGTDSADMADIEADLVGEPIVTGEKVKPLRMKISKAK